MSRDMRALFKRPRHPREWPRRAYLLVGVLVAAIALVVWLMIVALPATFPATVEADRWAAEATVIGAGALFFAVVATLLAVVAYVNSTEKPELQFEAAYDGRKDPLDIAWNERPPDKSGQVISVGEHPAWSLTLQLHNAGPVAARFVAIRVRCGPGMQLKNQRGPWSAGWPTLEPWRPALAERTQEWLSQAWWEGGADAVVHPSWPYPAHLLGPTPLRLTGQQMQTEFHFTVEVVADDVPLFKKTFEIKVPLGKG